MNAVVSAVTMAAGTMVVVTMAAVKMAAVIMAVTVTAAQHRTILACRFTFFLHQLGVLGVHILLLRELLSSLLQARTLLIVPLQEFQVGDLRRRFHGVTEG